MPLQFDFNKGPDKIFVDATSTALAFGKFLIDLKSGEQNHVFIFDIGHAKQLARILAQNIEVYEKQYGTVDGRLPNEPMPTPFQYPDKDSESGKTP